jgi:hypothetical protein
MNENFITLSSRILRDLDQGEDVVGIQHEQQRWGDLLSNVTHTSVNIHYGTIAVI